MQDKAEINNEREQIRAILVQLKPFFAINKTHFYVDLILSALVAWLPLAAIQVFSTDTALTIVLAIISYIGFYRGLAFIHETVHFYKKIPGLKEIYNVFFGFPIRAPLFVHTPHKFHHLPNTFATPQDPEYAYLKGSGTFSLFKPILAGIFFPLFLAIRFGVISTFSWVLPKKWRVALYQRASTIIVNPKYVRPYTDEELKQAQIEELGCALYFNAFLALIIAGVISMKLVMIMYAIMAIGSFINVWRARIAHLYDNQEEALSPLGQLRDSVTIENRWFSFLWAPLGLQYHSLHHLAPAIPYHNLQKAHRFLVQNFTAVDSYKKTIKQNPLQGIATFVRTVRAE